MRCLQLRALGHRADVVVAQEHCELLQLLQLLQGVGQARCAFMASEAVELRGQGHGGQDR